MAGIQVKGKKDDILNQLAASLSVEELERYTGDRVEMISQTGEQYLADHQSKWEYYSSSFYPETPYEDYMKQRGSKSPEEMEIESINDAIAKDHESFGRNAYYRRSGLYASIDNNKQALLDLLTVLRIDLSGVCAYKSIVELSDEFKDPQYAEIIFAPGLVNEIYDMKEWFTPSMIEEVYKIRLPLDATDQIVFMEIVSKILSHSLNAEEMKQYEQTLRQRFTVACQSIGSKR